jgi:hypothetical protein
MDLVRKFLIIKLGSLLIWNGQVSGGVITRAPALAARKNDWDASV